jgi:hypothetical protein
VDNGKPSSGKVTCYSLHTGVETLQIITVLTIRYRITTFVNRYHRTDLDLYNSRTNKFWNSITVTRMVNSVNSTIRCQSMTLDHERKC